MDVAVNYEAPDAFYRVEEGGETVPWRRKGRQQVEFFNASISWKREEVTTLGFHVEGRPEDAAVWWRPGARVGQRLD
jgi:hypothetical protein